jgi:aminoglycoside phosphotransferase (APT) family kinase protein
MTSGAGGPHSSSDLAAGIAGLLRETLAGNPRVAVTDPVRTFGGNARQAWSCSASWSDGGIDREEPLILLIRDTGSQVETDPAAEFAALEGLADQGVRAPRIWAQDPSGEVFGGSAVLLERLTGRTDAVEFLGADHETGRSRTLDLARAAAELHAASFSGAGESQVAHWRRQFEGTRLEPYPTIGWLFDWLDDHYVAPAREALVHGDFRPGNVLFDEGRIVGILDWEMAHVGDPLEDLAWAYRSLWSPKRFVPIEEFVTAYEEAGGGPVDLSALRWNRVLCELKFAVISLRASRSFVDGTSQNLRLIDRGRTVIPSMRRCLGWIIDVEGAQVPC